MVLVSLILAIVVFLSGSFANVVDTTVNNKKLPISVLLLAWKNPLSLNHSLQSYSRAGMFEMTSEFIICFNEITDAKVQSVKHYPVHVIGSVYNLVIARAMEMLFATAQYPYALFLEKDFSIAIDHSFVHSELKIAYETLAEKAVDVYHLRSRDKPGEPSYAKMKFQGKEDRLVAENSLYVCTFAYWLNNTSERWPQTFKHCGRHQVLCVKSTNCNWTNNPFMLSMTFWNQHIMPAILEMYHHHRYARINDGNFHGSPHLLEPWMDRQSSLWKDKNYTVAKGRGIFTHIEIDG